MAYVLDHGQIVRNEEIGQAELALQVHHQVEDLRLNGDIEGRNRFVGDDELRRERERARDPDTLALAAGALVRVMGHVRFAQPRAVLSLAEPRRWMRRGSPTMPPTDMRGSSEENGS